MREWSHNTVAAVVADGVGLVGGIVFVLDDPDDDESSDLGNITEIDEVEHISSVA